MARTIPVSSRDILYQAELATGKGVLRHVTVLANNPEARLAELLLMFHAAGDSSESDRQRLSDLIRVAQLGLSEGSAAATSFDPGHGPTLPTGGGSPVQISEVPETGEDQGKVVALERISERSVTTRHRPAAKAVAPSKKRPYRTYSSPEEEEAVGFAMLDAAGFTDKGEPVINADRFRSRMRINNERARAIWYQWYYSRKPHKAAPVVEQDVAQ